ncbi:MAG TPA: alanine--tRNA ligase [Patescibacteria group bacterium]|nr:alanine--tRNA ligase [Patescibacteria group bacterium]
MNFMITVATVRQRFLDFFREKGHTIIPSASLIPENDPTVLFTTAGMHPLVPYLLGEAHPAGTRLANCQKCLRTDDIEEVGDNRHLTFFEMLGNWSLGDYFKPEAIQWSFEFLTEAEWLNLDPMRLFVTVFEGDSDAPKDTDSISIWQSLFLTRKGIEADLGKPGKDAPSSGKKGPRIYAYPKKKNWWGPAGMTGPCGPDTEIFYDTGREHDPAFGPVCHPNCDCGRFVEIWNNVFMQYQKVKTSVGTEEVFAFEPLTQKNVDTGMGLERMAAVMQNVATVFDTEIFQHVFANIEERSGKKYGKKEEIDRSFRILADHLRAATFVIGDPRGVVPSNVGQGYIVRRLIRRAIREGRRLGINESFTHEIAEIFVEEFGDFYQELRANRERIVNELKKEEEKFGKTIEKGMRELEKMGTPTGEQAFVLFSTYGFPLELTEEILKERGVSIDRAAFESEFKKHQELSRTASAGLFKGGLADHSEQTTRLHTATHLLHRALREVLGVHVAQKGSNITAERLRFDFSHPQKMTPEEIARVESIVNEVIKKDLPVHFEEMTVDEAKKRGAIGLFEQKYGEKVKVYFMGEPDSEFSIEICGGPHVSHTGELGSFKIQKEEAVSAGVRRIKATVSGR